MKISYKLHTGNVNNNAVTIVNTRNGDISLCAFAKHAAFAGLDLRSRRNLESFVRLAENFLFFFPSFAKGHFSVIPPLANDPTELGQFSNRIGRAFADYFAKKIYGARWSVCYECVMKYNGIPLKGKRPDFYCISPTQQFIVEAKGWKCSNVTDAEIISAKNQALSCMQAYQRNILANFSVASIAYDIYNSPVIKFIDPEGNSTEYNEELNYKLRDDYYAYIRMLIENLSFTEFALQSQYKEATICNLDRPLKILINKNIFNEKQTDYHWLDEVETIEKEEYYIDRDGIGIFFDYSGS